MPTENYPAPLQLDLRAILQKRAPRLPAFVASILARIIHQQDLNAILRHAFPAAGTDFCREVLRYLNISLHLRGLENIPASGRLVFASNHPLGGLDGITLIAILGERYSDEGIIFPVNDMLMNVRPLEQVFTPVNKYGRQGRSRISGIKAAFESERHVIIFPAGLVSRRSPHGIRDLTWRKTFLTQAATTGRVIVPVHFEALNRPRFYRLAQWRKRLRIPFNLEQITLPAELVNCRDKTFRITFLPPVDPAAILQEHKSPAAAAEALRQSIYK